MLPAIELSQSMIDDPALSKLTQEYVIGAMLFSHQPEVRDEYMKTALSNHLMATVGVVPSARRMLDDEMGEALWKLRGEAMPTRYWAEGDKIKPGFQSGFFAGMVYRNAIEQGVRTKEFSIQDIKAEVTELARSTWKIKLRHSKLESAMKQHRRVAHLWCSYGHTAARWFMGLTPERPVFPYGPGGLYDFLWQARWYQEWGSRICPSGNPPLFSNRELLRIPDELKLNTELRFANDGPYSFPLPSDYPPGMNVPPLLMVERPVKAITGPSR